MGPTFTPDCVWLTPGGDALIRGPALGPFAEFELPPDAGAVARHVLATPAGAVVRAYSEPLPYAVDWTQGICNIHVVVGSEFRAYHWTEDSFGKGFVSLTFEVLLTGLRPLPPGRLPPDTEALRAAFRPSG